MTDALSIQKQIIVEAPAERAFRVFTANMTAWWPKTHHIGTSPLKTCVIEPREGGRWYEITEAGQECSWGKVLAWDPPRRLVLAWQLTMAYAYDPDFVTEVEVRFTALSPTRTQVDFEHRHLERFGERAPKQRDSMNQGWGQILDAYRVTASAPPADPA